MPPYTNKYKGASFFLSNKTQAYSRYLQKRMFYSLFHADFWLLNSVFPIHYIVDLATQSYV
jgi:hypothetical protein